MSRLLYEGFETRDWTQWTYVGGSPTIVANIPGMSGYCAFVNVNNWAHLEFPSRQELYFHFKWRHYWTSNTGAYMLSFYKGSTRLLSVCKAWNAAANDYTLTLHFGNDTYLRGVFPIHQYITYTVEVYYKPHPTQGVCVVRINGGEELYFVGNTTSGSIADFNRVSIRGWGSYDYNYYDDFVIDDERWVGPTSLGFLKINGDGDVQQWTPSSEPAYNCLNETPISMERFLTTSEPAQALFAVVDPPSLGANVVKGVQLMTLGTLTGNPAAMFHRQLLKSNGLVDRGPQISLPGALNPVYRMMAVNPTTNAPFTELDLASLQIGLEAEAEA